MESDAVWGLEIAPITVLSTHTHLGAHQSRQYTATKQQEQAAALALALAPPGPHRYTGNLQIRMAGVRNENEPPWMMGSLLPTDVWIRVTIPDTK